LGFGTSDKTRSMNKDYVIKTTNLTKFFISKSTPLSL